MKARATRTAKSFAGTAMGVFLALLCFTEIAHGQHAAKTVLVLYDGGREFAAIRLMDSGIESTLTDALPYRATIFREYMDLTRIYAPDYEGLLREFLRRKYSNNKPDAIIAVRGRPLDFLLKPGDELFPGVPIISSAMDLRQVQARKLPPHVTGNALEVRYWPSLALALTLQPETEQIFVVHGASPNDHALEALVRDELKSHERELKFTYLVGLQLDELMQRVTTLPPRSALLFVSFARDGVGRSFLPHDIVPRIASASNAPTYVASDDVIDTGVVGGDVISFAELGKDTASLALRILNVERVVDIPFMQFSKRVKMLDARQLERWGIPLSRVPPGSVILNRVPTVWELYRWHIIGGLFLMVVQSLLIATLLFNRRRRRLAEQNLEISEANRRAAVSDERNRMARDMHDTLAQGFTGIIVQLQAARDALAHGSAADTDAHVDRASALARQSLGEARRSIRALRPQALENGDLCSALGTLTRQMTTGTTFRTKFTTRGQPRRLAPSAEENLLRIHQEILTNALKHSRAPSIEAVLSFDEDAVSLEVEDDGCGFDPAAKHDGLGLMGIGERVRQMNGTFEVNTARTGTRIRVTLRDRTEAGNTHSRQPLSSPEET